MLPVQYIELWILISFDLILTLSRPFQACSKLGPFFWGIFHPLFSRTGQVAPKLGPCFEVGRSLAPFFWNSWLRVVVQGLVKRISRLVKLGARCRALTSNIDLSNKFDCWLLQFSSALSMHVEQEGEEWGRRGNDTWANQHLVHSYSFIQFIFYPFALLPSRYFYSLNRIE